MVQEWWPQREQGVAGKGGRQARNRVIKRHGSDENVEDAREEFADLIEAGQEGEQERRGDDEVQGAERRIPVGGQVDHDG